MRTMPRIRLPAVAAALAVLACSQKPDGESAPAADAQSAAPMSTQVPVHEAGPIEGIDWVWVKTVTPVDVIDVPDPGKYTLRLEAGKMAGQADCNRISGSYTLEGKSLQFGPLISTMAACPPESLGEKYAGSFEWIRGYFTVGDTLFMDLMADGGTLRFVRRR
jgi:heat shock protein HslJ